MKTKRITLTSKEISELLAVAIVTIVLLLLLNVSIMFLLGQLLSENSPLAGVIWATQDAVAKELNTDLFWSWNKFVLPIFFLVDAAVLYWRLIVATIKCNCVILSVSYITSLMVLQSPHSV